MVSMDPYQPLMPPVPKLINWWWVTHTHTHPKEKWTLVWYPELLHKWKNKNSTKSHLRTNILWIPNRDKNGICQINLPKDYMVITFQEGISHHWLVATLFVHCFSSKTLQCHILLISLCHHRPPLLFPQCQTERKLGARFHLIPRG